MYFAKITYLDGTVKKVSLTKQEETLTLTEAPDYTKVRFIDFMPDFLNAEAGNEGFYLISKGNTGVIFTRFIQRADTAFDQKYYPAMPILGATTPERSVLAIAVGMRYQFRPVALVKDGSYSLFFRIDIDGEAPYEAPSVIYHSFPQGATYVDMAKYYRSRRLAEDCTYLKDRAQKNPLLKYAVESPEIRIRQAWKPVPSPVPEQTPETEPPMHIACDFETVGRLVDEFQKQGVDKAEFCLVGWNQKGHDGRWPQAFPVEEALGGEKGLRKLISETQDKGYQIVCHTNSTDCYTVSNQFTEEYVCKHKDGSWYKNGQWSGGQMYGVCFERAYDIEQEILPQVAALGFRGLHYIDVLSVTDPPACYDSRHPLTQGESSVYGKKIADYAAQTFGGFASEGGADYLCGHMDFALYSCFRLFKIEDDICEEYVPFWQIVYHGLLLYNLSTETINYPVKSPMCRLKAIELGSRPAIYFYSKFLSNGSSWMGLEDFLCDTPEQMTESVAKIKKAYDEYRTLLPLQYETIENHEKLSDSVYRTTYSDGTAITVDYNTESYTVKKGTALL